MHLLEHICMFESVETEYEQYNLTIPVLKGNDRPVVFWSPCGRLFIVCVNSENTARGRLE
jgi:hypothetical protein